MKRPRRRPKRRGGGGRDGARGNKAKPGKAKRSGSEARRKETKRGETGDCVSASRKPLIVKDGEIDDGAAPSVFNGLGPLSFRPRSNRRVRGPCGCALKSPRVVYPKFRFSEIKFREAAWRSADKSPHSGRGRGDLGWRPPCAAKALPVLLLRRPCTYVQGERVTAHAAPFQPRV